MSTFQMNTSVIQSDNRAETPTEMITSLRAKMVILAHISAKVITHMNGLEIPTDLYMTLTHIVLFETARKLVDRNLSKYLADHSKAKVLQFHTNLSLEELPTAKKYNVSSLKYHHLWNNLHKHQLMFEAVDQLFHTDVDKVDAECDLMSLLLDDEPVSTPSTSSEPTVVLKASEPVVEPKVKMVSKEVPETRSPAVEKTEKTEKTDKIVKLSLTVGESESELSEEEEKEEKVKPKVEPKAGKKKPVKK
jgi:hypothetical protein